MRPFVAILACLAASCGGSATGQLRILLTDAPTDLANVSHVNVTFDEIRVHDDASGSGALPDAGTGDAGVIAGDAGTGDAGVIAGDEDGPGWIVVCSDTQTIDLLALTGGRFTPLCSQALADGGSESVPVQVPAGNISQVRLHVKSAELVFNDGTPTTSLKVPSGTTSGLKIDVNQSVPKGGLLEIKLDFDAAQSIHRTGNGSYIMEPVVRVVK